MAIKLKKVPFMLKLLTPKTTPIDLDTYIDILEEKYPDRKFDKNVRIMGHNAKGVMIRFYYTIRK